ncbi:MAG: glycosyltransferase family 2 protein, partial [Bacteroidales bacterium]
MQRQPRFSIITITYNAEKTLEPTIRSILEQDYPNIEYIIIDGASKDGTLKLIDRFRDRIAKVVSEPDKGLYDAMNKGLQHATGDYVWFINAGDALHSPFTVRRITEKIGDTMPDIIYGETALVNQERTFIGMRRLKA